MRRAVVAGGCCRVSGELSGESLFSSLGASCITSVLLLRQREGSIWRRAPAPRNGGGEVVGRVCGAGWVGWHRVLEPGLPPGAAPEEEGSGG